MRALAIDLLGRSWFALGWWMVGVLAMGGYVVAVYGSLGGTEALEDLWNSYPESVRELVGDVNIGTVDGWVQIEFMSWMPLVLGMYGGIFAAGNISREAETRTADFVLGLPVSRIEFMGSRLLVGVLNIGAICAGSFILLTVQVPLMGYDASPDRYALALANAFLLGAALFCGYAFIASFIDEQARVIGIAIGGTLVTYIVTAALRAAGAPDMVRWLSPFEHYRAADAMSGRAIDPGSLAVLTAAAVVFGAAALYWYNRRDLAV
jgi:ABC-type transport system involved in multi-copper enzyme maturation permease subunit